MAKKKGLEFIEDSNGCFIITSHTPNSGGYATMRNNGRITLAHRFVYEQCFGTIPEGLVVRHKCDVRRCINPEHLELGTQSDNCKDTAKRGRTRRGENHPFNTKLTEKQVKEILGDTETLQKDLAIKYGVSKSYISNIKTHKKWKHLGR